MILRFERGEPVPDAHTTVYMRGGMGEYRIRIHSIVSQEPHPDGATLLKVRATKNLVVEDGGNE